MANAVPRTYLILLFMLGFLRNPGIRPRDLHGPESTYPCPTFETIRVGDVVPRIALIAIHRFFQNPSVPRGKEAGNPYTNAEFERNVLSRSVRCRKSKR